MLERAAGLADLPSSAGLPSVDLGRFVVQFDPPISVWHSEVRRGTEGHEQVWPETYGSAELARAFLRGVKAGCAVGGLGYVDVPDPDDPDLPRMDKELR